MVPLTVAVSITTRRHKKVDSTTRSVSEVRVKSTFDFMSVLSVDYIIYDNAFLIINPLINNTVNNDARDYSYKYVY
jgi:hypothetical protein